jgi:hypothetical protein
MRRWPVRAERIGRIGIYMPHSPVWSTQNLRSTEGVGPVQRRSPGQQDTYADVDPQPEIMIVVVDESDPHANQRDSSSVTYGVLYCLRADNVQDKDRFWYEPHLDGEPVGQKFLWGVVGGDRWNQDHAMTGVNFGVKQFRIRKGG